MTYDFNEEQLIEIGELADEADNYIAASRMPIPNAIHVEAMRSGFVEMRDKLRRLYTVLAGDNPWEPHTKAHEAPASQPTTIRGRISQTITRPAFEIDYDDDPSIAHGL